MTVGNGPTSVDSNTAVGSQALQAQTGGIANTAIGGNAMYLSSGGSDNTALGFAAGQDIEGNGNTALGRATLSATNLAGSYNIGIGYFAGLAVTAGSGNILIGSGSGRLITNGSDNVIIGGHPGSASLTKVVALTDASGSVILWGTGSKVTIGAAATPNATLDVRGDTVITGSLVVTGSQTITGSLTVTGNITNILGMGFVSCSLLVSGSSTVQRAFSASFKDVDGTSIPRAQSIHWWTSGTETGSASTPTAGAGPVTYLVVSGSNIVPISNSGSINHAVTDNNGNFAVRLTGASGGTTQTIWFNTEVQGIIYSISTTITAGAA
jgi:hypothetical protein